MSEQDALFPWKGLEVQPSGRRPIETAVPVEIPLVVEVNGRPAATLMALPGMERELAVGFCLGDGLVASFPDIFVVHYCRDEAAFPGRDRPGGVVRLQVRPEAVREQGSGPRLVLSGCGSVPISLEALELPPLPPPGGPLLSSPALWAMARTLRRSPPLYRQAGAVHAAGLFDPAGESLVLAEDIGRHNAVDKVLGAALLRGLPLSDKVLLTTGRASHELVVKALRLGVPVAGSLSAPTSLALELAQQGRCTLVGRLRRERFVVYTCPERIG